MFFGLIQEITVIESIVVCLMVVEQQLYLLEYQIQVCHGILCFTRITLQISQATKVSNNICTF
jgi:hypothetical protein